MADVETCLALAKASIGNLLCNFLSVQGQKWEDTPRWKKSLITYTWEEKKKHTVLKGAQQSDCELRLKDKRSPNTTYGGSVCQPSEKIYSAQMGPPMDGKDAQNHHPQNCSLKDRDG